MHTNTSLVYYFIVLHLSNKVEEMAKDQGNEIEGQSEVKEKRSKKLKHTHNIQMLQVRKSS